MENGRPCDSCRPPRAPFAAMVSAYALGAFNDNFFKQAVCLIAVFAGQDSLQGVVTVVFALPWLLCAAPAGWLADRFPKRRVVIGAKALEVIAMACGAAGILMMNWPLILLMVFLMSLQSTVFSPALNGSIPEVFPPEAVLRVNAVVKMLVTCGILAGIILGGMALSCATPVAGVPLGRAIVAAAVLAVAAVGLAVSLGVPHRPAADPGVRFPWSGPVATLRTLWRMRRDRLLAIAVAADAFVWFVAVLQVLVVNQLGRARFGLDEQQTSFLLVAELGGLAAGGLLAGRIAGPTRWRRELPPAMALLALSTALIAATPLLPAAGQLAWTAAMLVLAGAAGGVLLVPLESFFQVRAAAGRKGAVIAAANFAGFVGVLLAGLADMGLQRLLAPAARFGVIAALTLAAAVALWRAFRGREAHWGAVDAD